MLRPHPPLARRASSRLLAAAAAVAGVLLVLAPLPAAQAAPAAVIDGYLTWGIKDSFRTYVTGPVGQGTIDTTGDATRGDDGTFTFPGATGSADHAGGLLDVGVRGGARFLAHHGALDLRIDDLRIIRSGTAGAVVADVVSRDLDTGVFVDHPDVTLATLDFAGVSPTASGEETTYADVPATLTADGESAFADFYPAGTPLDPVTLVTGTRAGVTPTTTATTATTVLPTTTTFPPATVAPYGTATAEGPEDQRLTVTPAYDLDPSGARLRVQGEGFDPSLGIYLGFCVDRGPDLPPSPCLGGIDTAGQGDASAWISSDPPPYGVGVAVPFGPGGTFDRDIEVTATAVDDTGRIVADCYDPGTRCVVATRADHTQAGDRRADVKVPVAFVGQTERPATVVDPVEVTVTVTPDAVVAGGTLTVHGEGLPAGEQVGATLLPDGTWLGNGTADAEGRVALTLTVPATTPTGPRTLELRGLSSNRSGVSGTFTVLAAPGAAPRLPATGADPRVAVAGVLLVAAGASVLGLRQAARRAAG